MKINYYKIGNKLFDQNNNEVIHDEAGIITIIFCGEIKRFNLLKFLRYLDSNPHIIQWKPDRKTGRRRGIRKEKVKLPHASILKRMPIKMIDNKGTVHLFESISECARRIKIGKSIISKSLNGKCNNIKGYRFEKIERKHIA